MSIVEARRTAKATRNAGDSVAKYLERTATLYNRLQIIQEMKQLKKALNLTE
jgi:hypothetical protein